MNEQVSFEIENDEYVVTATSFTPGTAPTRDDPGDGPEVEVSDVVTWKPGGGKDEYEVQIPFEHFVRDYAADHKITVLEADRAIMSRVTDEVEQRVGAAIEDAYDDRDPYEAFDYGGDA